MEMKKSEKAQLGRKRGQFLIIGVIVALSVTISAFEWKTYGDIGTVPDSLIVIDEPEWEPVVTKQEIKKPPKPKIAPKLVVVPDDEPDLDPEEFIIDVGEIEDFDPSEFEDSFIEEVDLPFLWVEDMPEFEGGQVAFMKYIAKHIKYPSQARRMGIEGKVFVEFIIDKEGRLIDVKAIKGIGAGCDEEAVRVLKEAPAWKPGKQRGKPVKVKMVLPIYFQLG